MYSKHLISRVFYFVQSKKRKTKKLINHNLPRVCVCVPYLFFDSSKCVTLRSPDDGSSGWI